ncbi:MAG: hypothetical protein CM1200mP6_06780 [Anaerolineaceae bacterium]|nr:MAG: hypothetical protein CM1200mP6_06780 [Anaerolineaceae bacterium]
MLDIILLNVLVFKLSDCSGYFSAGDCDRLVSLLISNAWGPRRHKLDLIIDLELLLQRQLQIQQLG